MSEEELKHAAAEQESFAQQRDKMIQEVKDKEAFEKYYRVLETDYKSHMWLYTCNEKKDHMDENGHTAEELRHILEVELHEHDHEHHELEVIKEIEAKYDDERWESYEKFKKECREFWDLDNFSEE